MSLYKKLGGESAVLAAVHLFYDKVLENPLVSSFFAGLDMEKQIQKQASFMKVAFGGTAEYTGKDLMQAHAHLVRDQGLTDVHFDEVAKLLHESLAELGVEDVLITEVMDIVESTRDMVLGRVA
jgi:hemoglobin